MAYRDKADLKAWYTNNKENVRYRHIHNKYGLTRERFFSMLEEQDGKCALCLEPFKSLGGSHCHIDHCHDTGAIRGLLCMSCNVGLGMLGDTEEGLLNALEYLRKSK